MKRLLLAAATALICTAAHPHDGNSPFAPALSPRKVAGLITQVEGESLTISPTLNHTTHHMTGKLDPKRTRVTINGRAARTQDLRITLLAKGEMGIDDVWVAVNAERK